MSLVGNAPRPSQGTRSARPRNAAATRAAILEAACERFVHEGYDEVGMRDIARDVGVDAALVSRYFGSKENLFVEVLKACDDRAWMEGDKATVGRRLAHDLIYGPNECEDFRVLLIMLRSTGSAQAAQIMRRAVDRQFIKPIEAWLGGGQAHARAVMASSLMLGVALHRTLAWDEGLDEAAKAAMFERLSEMLQRCVDG